MGEIDEYRRVLHEWARRKLGEDAIKVTKVDITWDEGREYSSYTIEDPSFEIWVHFERADGSEDRKLFDDDAQAGMGQLLQDLFKIAEEGPLEGT